jgi:hypothetical protein
MKKSIVLAASAALSSLLLVGCGAKPTPPQVITKAEAVKKMEEKKFEKSKEVFSTQCAIPSPITKYGPFGTCGKNADGSKRGIVFVESDGTYILTLPGVVQNSYKYDMLVLEDSFGYKSGVGKKEKQEMIDRLPSYKFDSIIAGDVSIPVTPGRSAFRLPKNADLKNIKFVFKVDKMPTVYESCDQKSKDLLTAGGAVVLTMGLALVNPNFWENVTKGTGNKVMWYVDQELKNGAEKITIVANTPYVEDKDGTYCKNQTPFGKEMNLVCSKYRELKYISSPIPSSSLPLACRTGMVDEELGISADDVSGGSTSCNNPIGQRYLGAIDQLSRFEKGERHVVSKKQ